MSEQTSKSKLNWRKIAIFGGIGIFLVLVIALDIFANTQAKGLECSVPDGSPYISVPEGMYTDEESQSVYINAGIALGDPFATDGDNIINMQIPSCTGPENIGRLQSLVLYSEAGERYIVIVALGYRENNSDPLQ